GPAGFFSLWYAPMDRLALEARFGLGEIGWKISQSDIDRFPEYFGAGARLGDLYPGTQTTIEPTNESRLTTMDLMVHYVLVANIPAVPFISAGVGMINYAPSTAEAHDALPNYAAGVYSGSAFSIPLGGGVRIPLSDRVGLTLRGEYRLVWSKYLDDISANGSNDAVTSASIGLSYQFTDPAPSPRRRHHHHHHHLRKNEQCQCCDGIGRHQRNCDCGAMDDEEMDEAPAPAQQKAPSATPDTSRAPAPSGTITDTTTTPTTPPTTTPATTPETTSLAPCPQGTARVCVQANESVCVDTNITPGADRIKWEEAFIYEPGGGTHQQTVRAVNADKPCYDVVVRQTATTYYLCKDCCFEKIKLGGQWVYVILDEGQISKGQGTFMPANCPDCDAVAASGR
ncbi:MAG: porin family protein, partial [Ignavibacteriae bacterium]